MADRLDSSITSFQRPQIKWFIHSFMSYIHIVEVLKVCREKKNHKYVKDKRSHRPRCLQRSLHLCDDDQTCYVTSRLLLLSGCHVISFSVYIYVLSLLVMNNVYTLVYYYYFFNVGCSY